MITDEELIERIESAAKSGAKEGACEVFKKNNKVHINIFGGIINKIISVLIIAYY